MGDDRGCAKGMEVTSIQCKEQNIFGHDGMMSHGPIAVGACYGNKDSIMFRW